MSDANGKGDKVHRITVTNCVTGQPPYEYTVPFIRIRGRYLERAGFPEGVRVQVMVEQGRITLEPIRDERGAAAKARPGLLVRLLERKTRIEAVAAEDDAGISSSHLSSPPQPSGGEEAQAA